MNALVVYDTNFGNTKLVAEAIAKELGGKSETVSKVTDSELKDLDFLVLGSPINGWRETETMGKFLKSLKPNQLENTKAATFDTRIKLFIHGDAAGKISKGLEKAGAKVVVEPEGFYVKGRVGPLSEGELERAKEWAREIKELTQ